MKVASTSGEEAGNARARRKVLDPSAESQEAGANDANTGSIEEYAKKKVASSGDEEARTQGERSKNEKGRRVNATQVAVQVTRYYQVYATRLMLPDRSRPLNTLVYAGFEIQPPSSQ